MLLTPGEFCISRRHRSFKLQKMCTVQSSEHRNSNRLIKRFPTAQRKPDGMKSAVTKTDEVFARPVLLEIVGGQLEGNESLSEELIERILYASCDDDKFGFHVSILYLLNEPVVARGFFLNVANTLLPRPRYNS